MTVEFTARARAFTGHPVQEHRFSVDPQEPDPQVRVWDSIAGHYTSCHRLSPAQQRRLVELAARHG